MGELTSFPINTKTYSELDPITDAQATDSDGVLFFDQDVGLMKRMTRGELFKNKVTPIDSIAEFPSLDTDAFSDRQQFNLGSFAPDGEDGGGIMLWEPDQPKSLHDGINYFSPTVPIPADFNNPTDVANYRAGDGEEWPAGNGIFVLNYFVSRAEFEAVEDRQTDTVTTLATLSLPIGSKVTTKGCLAIGDGGQGDFIVEAASGSPDGYSRVLLANGNHAVISKNTTIRPYHFGVTQVGLAGSALQLFFDFVAVNDGYLVDMSCRCNIDRAYNYTSTIEDRTISGILVLTVVSNIPDRYVLKINSRFDEFDGGFAITAVGSDLFDVGIKADAIGRDGIRHLSVRRANNFALQYTAAANNNMAAVDKIVAFECGRERDPITPTFVSHTAATNSTSRRANFTVTLTDRQKRSISSMPISGGLPVLHDLIFTIDGTPHAVTSYDPTTGAISVYPGMLDAYDYGAAVYTLSHGGAVFTFGGDGGQLLIGMLDARICGTAWRSAALYGGHVSQLIAQQCAASYVNGIPPVSVGGFGDYIGHIYQENVFFRGIITSTAGTCVISSTAEAAMNAWLLQPPLFAHTAGKGNRRITLSGTSTQFNLESNRYEKYKPEAARQNATVITGVGTYDILLPATLGGIVLVDSANSEARAIVLVSSYETSTATRHSTSILLSNNHGTGGATYSVVLVGNRDYLRVTEGSTSLAGHTWRTTETSLVQPVYPQFF